MPDGNRDNNPPKREYQPYPVLFTVPTVIVRDSSLSLGARVLYSIICSYSLEVNQPQLSNNRLQEDLGVSWVSLAKYKNELIDRNLLIVIPRFSHDGSQEINAYQLMTVMEVEDDKA